MSYMFHEDHNVASGVMELSVFDTGPKGHDVIIVSMKTNHIPGKSGQGYGNFSMQLAPEDIEWLAVTLLDTLDRRGRETDDDR